MHDVLLLVSPQQDLQTLARYLRAAELRGDMELYQALLRAPDEFLFGYVVTFEPTRGVESANQSVIRKFSDIPRYRQLEYGNREYLPPRS